MLFALDGPGLSSFAQVIRVSQLSPLEAMDGVFASSVVDADVSAKVLERFQLAESSLRAGGSALGDQRGCRCLRMGPRRVP